jgi:CRP/FNR family cyclic AMP-dependent transcriptional regulator
MEENVKPLSEIPAINRFLSYCRIRAVPSKTVVIHAGDLPDVLYYIISGSVEVMIEDEEGNEMVLAYLNRGQFLGEMGPFYEQPTRSKLRTRPVLLPNDLPRFRQIAAEPGTGVRARHAPPPLDPHQPQARRPGLVDVTGRVAHAIPIVASRCHNPPEVCRSGKPPGALAPGRLLARMAGRVLRCSRAGPAARHRQDHVISTRPK